MSAFSEARIALADAIKTDEWPCHPSVPESIEPACFVIQPADPYIELTERTFSTSEFDLSLAVFVIPQLLSNEQAYDDLDTMLDHLLGALPEGWGLDRISKPQGISTSGWSAFGMPVTVSRFITL